MNIREAYDQWALQYDGNCNRTRDLEAVSLRESVSQLSFESVLEIGCGTGKNTEWLAGRSTKVLAVDFSEGMLSIARSKELHPTAKFIQADIREEWKFTQEKFDLVVFSLVLEHLPALDDIFQKTAFVLNERGYVYIGELHPFKQYEGSQARFETLEGTQLVESYTHHISDYTTAAAWQSLKIVALREYFDEAESGIPRILSLLLRKC